MSLLFVQRAALLFKLHLWDLFQLLLEVQSPVCFCSPETGLSQPCPSADYLQQVPHQMPLTGKTGCEGIRNVESMAKSGIYS